MDADFLSVLIWIQTVCKDYKQNTKVELGGPDLSKAKGYDVMSVLIWIQTVCKGYQQTTKVNTGKQRAKKYFIFFKIFFQKHYQSAKRFVSRSFYRS